MADSKKIVDVTGDGGIMKEILEEGTGDFAQPGDDIKGDACQTSQSACLPACLSAPSDIVLRVVLRRVTWMLCSSLHWHFVEWQEV